MKPQTIIPEIELSQDLIDKVIERYKQLSPHYYLAVGPWKGNRDDIIKEIKNMSDIGKWILLMDYNFNQAYPELMKEKEEKNETANKL